MASNLNKRKGTFSLPPFPLLIIIGGGATIVSLLKSGRIFCLFRLVVPCWVLFWEGKHLICSAILGLFYLHYDISFCGTSAAAPRWEWIIYSSVEPAKEPGSSAMLLLPAHMFPLDRHSLPLKSASVLEDWRQAAHVIDANQTKRPVQGD